MSSKHSNIKETQEEIDAQRKELMFRGQYDDDGDIMVTCVHCNQKSSLVFGGRCCPVMTEKSEAGEELIKDLFLDGEDYSEK